VTAGVTGCTGVKPTGPERRDVIYATRGLVEVLLEFAADAEPESVSVELSVTKAGVFGDDVGLDPETPVLSHFYMPEAGQSVGAVFGMDLTTSAGQTQGRFVSHPDGELRVRREDDLHGIVLVAVPPWDRESVRAFARDGTGRELGLLDAAPPEEAFEGDYSR
jgi:hypothetical protein